MFVALCGLCRRCIFGLSSAYASLALRCRDGLAVRSPDVGTRVGLHQSRYSAFSSQAPLSDLKRCLCESLKTSTPILLFQLRFSRRGGPELFLFASSYHCGIPPRGSTLLAADDLLAANIAHFCFARCLTRRLELRIQSHRFERTRQANLVWTWDG